MTMQFADIARQAAADGAVSAEEILTLRRAGWADGTMSPAEAEAVLALNDALAERSPEWCDFFVEAIGEFVINGTAPKGYVSEENAAWLIARLDRDGSLDSMAELELLVRVLERASDAPASLKTYALAQIEQAVLTGTGPTRRGGELSSHCVSDAEAQLLRRVLFAAGGDAPAAVSRAEAELLFRRKDASRGAPNGPEWKRLFVQGVPLPAGPRFANRADRPRTGRRTGSVHGRPRQQRGPVPRAHGQGKPERVRRRVWQEGRRAGPLCRTGCRRAGDGRGKRLARCANPRRW